MAKSKRGECTGCGREMTLIAGGLCWTCYEDPEKRAEVGLPPRGSKPAKKRRSKKPKKSQQPAGTPLDASACASLADRDSVGAVFEQMSATQREAAEFLQGIAGHLADAREANKTLREALIRSRAELLETKKQMEVR